MPERRFKELDSLRGVAALWVVVFHLTFGLGHVWLRDEAELVSTIAPFTVNTQGLLAVDLFFIISGFVIGMTVERSQTLLDFAVSRFARLYPAFWAAVIISTSLGILLPSTQLPVTLSMGIANLTMLQDYIGVRAVDRSYWSLSVELGFYGLMACVLLTGQRERIEKIGFIWVLAAFAFTHLLPLTGVSLPWRVSTALVLSHANLFYAGILFYKIRTDRFTWARAGAIALCLALKVAFASPVAAAIECAIFLTFALCVADKLTVLRARPLLFLGTISYSLYIIHQPLGFRLQLGFHALGLPPWPNMAATLGVLLALATLLTYTVERPGNRYIRHAFANRREKVLVKV